MEEPRATGRPLQAGGPGPELQVAVIRSGWDGGCERPGESHFSPRWPQDLQRQPWTVSSLGAPAPATSLDAQRPGRVGGPDTPVPLATLWHAQLAQHLQLGCTCAFPRSPTSSSAPGPEYREQASSPEAAPLTSGVFFLNSRLCSMSRFLDCSLSSCRLANTVAVASSSLC